MADSKISQLTYYPNNTTPGELPDTNTVFAVDSGSLTYKAQKWQILSNKLLSFRDFLKSFNDADATKFLMGYSGSGGGIKISLLSPLTLNASNQIGVTTATYTSPGIASFSSSDFTVTSGSVTIKESGISHSLLSGLTNDDHTQYVKYTGGNYNTNVIATWNDTTGRFIKASGSSATVDSSGNISANNIKAAKTPNSIPISDGNGFLNSWFKETVYLKVVPETTPIPQNTAALIKFNVPRVLSGRAIKYVKCRIYSITGENNTIYLKNNGTTIATLSNTTQTIEATISAAISTDNTLQVDTGTATGTGLDLYFEVE